MFASRAVLSTQPLVSVPVLPVPEESDADVPEVSSSFHQPTRLLEGAAAPQPEPP